MTFPRLFDLLTPLKISTPHRGLKNPQKLVSTWHFPDFLLFCPLKTPMGPPCGGVGHIFLAENESHIYPNMRAKFGCDPTVVSKKNWGTDRQTDKGTLQLYIVEGSSSPLQYKTKYDIKVRHDVNHALWWKIWWKMVRHSKWGSAISHSLGLFYSSLSLSLPCQHYQSFL